MLRQFFGFAAVSLGGTILHFLYDWLGGAVWIAPFSGVNESTWEHMKLLFWPMLAFAIAESLFFREREDFWCIKARGIILGLASIPTLFYAYNGIIGKSPDWINISIFFIATAIAFLYETRKLNQPQTACRGKRIYIISLCIIVALFVIFTFITPRINLFKDPITNSYGI